MVVPSPFTGPKMDALFEKAMQVHATQNGWTKLESTAAKPIDVGILLNPGNYSLDYWTGGPSDLNQYIGRGPLSLINYSDEQVIRQYVFFFGVTYNGWFREYDKDTETFTDWKVASKNEYTEVGTSAPTNPVNHQVWVDTTDANAPVFKYYDETSTSWKIMLPGDVMLASIYDSTNKQEDFFDYADEEFRKVREAAYNGTNVDYVEHISDATRHVSNDEIADWEDRITKSDLASKINVVKDELQQSVVDQVAEFKDNINDATTRIAAGELDLDQHITDYNIHLRKPAAMVYNTYTSVGWGDPHLDSDIHKSGYTAYGFNDLTGVALMAMFDDDGKLHFYSDQTYSGGYAMYDITDGISISNVPAMSECRNMRMFVTDELAYLHLADNKTYRSLDEVTWTRTTSLPGRISSVIRLESGDYYALSIGNGIYQSTDGVSFVKVPGTDDAIGTLRSLTKSDSHMILYSSTSGLKWVEINDSSKFVIVTGEVENSTSQSVWELYSTDHSSSAKYAYAISPSEIRKFSVSSWDSSEVINAAFPSKITTSFNSNCQLYTTLYIDINNIPVICGFFINEVDESVFFVWTSDPKNGWYEKFVPNLSAVNFGVYGSTLTASPNILGGVRALLPIGHLFAYPYYATKDYLDNKADPEHVHSEGDDTIKLDASHITGLIPIELIPDTLKDVTVKVNNQTEMLALTPTTIQNGDFIYVTNDKLLFLVVDDSQLGTMDAFVQYSTGAASLAWENFTGVPTSISGLGITDLPIKTKVNTDVNAMASNNSQTSTFLETDVNPYIALLTTANLTKVVKAQSALDSAILKAKTLLNKSL